MRLPVMPPVAPMLARPVAGIPAGQWYEPKWDGFRAIVFRDGAEVEIGSRTERPITRYFPEIVAAALRSLPPRCVLDGEIVVPDADRRGLDFFALQQRIHPAASRVELLAERTPAILIAFDLLAIGDEDCTPRPFRERRALLERVLNGVAPPIHLTPITDDPEVARRWFEAFEGAGLDGLIAKRGDEPYQPNKRVLAKIKHERTADCVVAGYRVHKSGPDRIGSLLLGLYDDPATPASPLSKLHGGLAPVGVVAAFPMARRAELFAELQPLIVPIEEHPWLPAALEIARMRGGRTSKWNDKDASFVPLRPERVIEVRYDYLEHIRFRHPAQFVRWRPDRAPASCNFTQLERPARLDVATVLSGGAGREDVESPR